MSSFYCKSTVIHECTNFYYKQLKSVHKVRSNYGTIFVKLVKCHLRLSGSHPSICKIYVFELHIEFGLHSFNKLNWHMHICQLYINETDSCNSANKLNVFLIHNNQRYILIINIPKVFPCHRFACSTASHILTKFKFFN